MKQYSMLKIASRVAYMPQKEGRLAVPIGQVIAHLQKYLCAKYAIDAAYRSFADRVKGPWRDALYEHWDEHAAQERKAAYDLAMKIVGLAADPIVTAIQIPPCTANLMGFMKCLESMELDAIENGRVLIQLAGDNTSMRVFAENLILVDTQHQDDLIRMMARIDL